ncbi:hypothetical protein [Pedobacter heparinus]|uniref:Secreted protein n=1 Tax=Pedobacter heparinus (strain ATCC 13125 / DSM 2366 / CIP 104194 / JCM 7457 / NBRC 12017 / NCIMB 9290 / NRRL B-14731 / HIM 762-3) TaxID=485917 RepID=C6XVF0_PEDHD|nr:hypothetical protein [Pedobacter heparinus]ACU04016.1 hypothetical protein Phep_1807 [Pedobacter heparinus DSM 2366]
MRFKKFFLLGAVAMALTATFAFKAKPEFVVCSAKNPLNTFQCMTLLITDDDCTTYNTGDQCTTYYSASYPSLPAYTSPGGGVNPGPCVVPLYHQEW